MPSWTQINFQIVFIQIYVKFRLHTYDGMSFSIQDEEEDDEDIDSLFSPNASNLASPCPSAHNLSLTSSRPEDDLSLPVENESSLRGQMSMAVVVGDRAGEVDKDAPAKRTRQNFSLKDKPLEVSR